MKLAPHRGGPDPSIALCPLVQRVPTTMNGGLLYTAADGREWMVTLESPGAILSVPPSLEKSGALLPEHEVRIVFTSGDLVVSEEYTALTPLEDLSDDNLQEWLDAALAGTGL